MSFACQVGRDGVGSCVESGFGELFAHVDDVLTQGFWDCLWVCFRSLAARFDGFFAAFVVAVEQGVDPLPGDFEVTGSFGDRVVLVPDVADDGEVSVRGVHLSTMSRLRCQPSELFPAS